MGWSPSALFHEMLLLCIPKLWKQRYRWLNFGSVFSVWSVFLVICLFLYKLSFFFFFAWQYVWFLLFPRSCDEQSNQIPVVKTWSRDHTCTRILTRTVFGICSDFLCASRSCHTTLKLTWFCLFFFPCGVFANGQIDVGFLHW